MKAIITNLINDVSVEVYSTTEHSASSYGRAIWVDDENNPYFEVGTCPPFYKIEILEEDEPTHQ